MEMQRIAGHIDGADGDTYIAVTVRCGKLPLVSAIASVAALFSGEVSRGTASPLPAGEATAATTASTEPVATGTRTRRPRTAPTEVAPSPAPDAAPANVTDIGTRRRRSTAPAEPEGPKAYTDADMSKAASNAAAAIHAVGEALLAKGAIDAQQKKADFDGPGIIMAVLLELNAKSTNDLTPDQREPFLAEIQKEVEAAELEAKVKLAS